MSSAAFAWAKVSRNVRSASSAREPASRSSAGRMLLNREWCVGRLTAEVNGWPRGIYAAGAHSSLGAPAAAAVDHNRLKRVVKGQRSHLKEVVAIGAVEVSTQHAAVLETGGR